MDVFKGVVIGGRRVGRIAVRGVVDPASGTGRLEGLARQEVDALFCNGLCNLVIDGREPVWVRFSDPRRDQGEVLFRHFKAELNPHAAYRIGGSVGSNPSDDSL